MLHERQRVATGFFTERMNAKAAKVAKGAAAQLIGESRGLHVVGSVASLAAFAFIVVGAIAA